MTEPFVGEIQLFGFNFNPRGWAFCNGALLPISQNTALFSLLGVQYGGNGMTTFALPNLTGRAACGIGQGPGLTPHSAGEAFGSSSVTLTGAEIPAHGHGGVAYSQTAPGTGSGTPVNGGGLSFLASSTAARSFASPPGNTTMAPSMIQPAGGSQPHENRQPYLAVNFCIALEGIFPQRN